MPRVHKSFADFITCAKAEEFRVDLTESNGELALQSINQLLPLWEDYIPTQLLYAMSHWSSHLTHVVGVPAEPEETDDDTASDYDARSISSNPEADAGPSDPVNHPQPRKQPASPDQLRSVSVSPDGSRIAYARGTSVLLKDVKTGNFIEAPFDGHTDDVRSVTFSPDGRYVASASDDMTIRVWDVTTGELVGKPLKGHTYWVLAADFSADGSQIVSASADNTIRIWDAKTGSVLRVLTGHTNHVHSAVFSPDSRYIVSASRDRTVRVWRASTGGSAVHVFKGHSTFISSALFSPDGKHILSCSSQGIIMVWDSETGKKVRNGCIDAASLSFAGTESSSYIVTPQTSITAAQSTSTLSSYSFNVAGIGIAGGISGVWLYFNPEKKFIMSAYLGQLTIRHVYGLGQSPESRATI